MSSDPLVPYHGLSPDAALSALGEPLGTNGFAVIAEACRRGRDDLAGRGLDERGQKSLRRFSTWEITKYLIPVAPAHFRRVLRQNPELPQGLTETEGGAKWFTLCGSVGDSDDRAFVIGNTLSNFSPEDSGELCAFANDLDGYYGNNSGYLKIRVTAV